MGEASEIGLESELSEHIWHARLHLHPVLLAGGLHIAVAGDLGTPVGGTEWPVVMNPASFMTSSEAQCRNFTTDQHIPIESPIGTSSHL
jgi:hypothetical protein